MFYAFPPFICIGKCIKKIITDKAYGILIVPNWPYQPWYPLLLDYCVTEPFQIPFSANQLYLPSNPALQHPLHKQLQLLACLVSG